MSPPRASHGHVLMLSNGPKFSQQALPFTATPRVIHPSLKPLPNPLLPLLVFLVFNMQYLPYWVTFICLFPTLKKDKDRVYNFSASFIQ